MIDQRILWKDGIHLTDDTTKILAADVLNYLNIEADFHSFEIRWIDNKQAK